MIFFCFNFFECVSVVVGAVSLTAVFCLSLSLCVGFCVCVSPSISVCLCVCSHLSLFLRLCVSLCVCVFCGCGCGFYCLLGVFLYLSCSVIDVLCTRFLVAFCVCLCVWVGGS